MLIQTGHLLHFEEQENHAVRTRVDAIQIALVMVRGLEKKSKFDVNSIKSMDFDR